MRPPPCRPETAVRAGLLVTLVLGCGGATAPADGGAVPDGHTAAFRRIVLTTDFLSEGAAFGDFDRDGVNDVVAGPYWYGGPDFSGQPVLYPPHPFDPRGDSHSLFALPHDFDGDGWLDVLVVG